MPINHIVTIGVAPGRAADFARAFKDLKAVVEREEGCERYDLFQNMDDPDTLVMLERWTNQELLDKHTEAERGVHARLIDALIALWAPGITPTFERFED
ncbi:antibiotic biosynthesis monooxygenase [Nocardia sp. NBC_01503]|uniref:putative quinol monooxygenase n=1 Tax=Nocardia sp. NBC_01503 TaxID=2975997 RepID=UPI002E7B4661|nr:antibiotic biosynthesis monooxygenase family protein [Nocardia sp. NBC_01503]WTL30816.1 antibiotic biosynthesis monooxygenase [Nocardia sp. NBC_01503]